MSFLTLRPSPPLADVIQLYWIYQGATPAHAFERVLPMGREEIIINLSDGELRCYEEDGQLHNRTSGPIVTGMHRSTSSTHVSSPPSWVSISSPAASGVCSASRPMS